MRPRVVLTGWGAVSCLGDDAAATWEQLLAGRTGVAPVAMLRAAGAPMTWGGATSLGLEPDRELRLAGRAIDAALQEAGRTSATAALVWAAGLEAPAIAAERCHWPGAGAVFTEIARRFAPPHWLVATACAAGAQAIGEAVNLVRRGRADACVAGGSSAMLSLFHVLGFARLGVLAADPAGGSAACRPFDRGRRGIAIGDGAAAVVVETLEGARRRGAHPLVEICGYGSSQDAHDLHHPADDGAGALLAMRRALDDAELEAAELDAVNAHATGTIAGDAAEAAALRALLGERWPQVPVSSIKGALGHTMMAAGAIELVVAAQSALTGLVPPTAGLTAAAADCELRHVTGAPSATGARTVMSTSFGMGGQNAAIIVRRME